MPPVEMRQYPRTCRSAVRAQSLFQAILVTGMSGAEPASILARRRACCGLVCLGEALDAPIAYLVGLETRRLS